jgi:hypothetical protein
MVAVPKRRHVMKPILLLSTLAAGLVVVTTSFAQSAQIRPVPPNPPGNVYESYSLGHQSYPNPDRDYLGENRYPAPTR